MNHLWTSSQFASPFFHFFNFCAAISAFSFHDSFVLFCNIFVCISNMIWEYPFIETTKWLPWIVIEPSLTHTSTATKWPNKTVIFYFGKICIQQTSVWRHRINLDLNCFIAGRHRECVRAQASDQWSKFTSSRSRDKRANRRVCACVWGKERAHARRRASGQEWETHNLEY